MSTLGMVRALQAARRDIRSALWQPSDEEAQARAALFLVLSAETAARASQEVSVITPVEIGVLPASWQESSPLVIEGSHVRRFTSAFGLHVLVGVEDRGPSTGIWRHVSVSRSSKLPSWNDLREVKDLFIGRERCAIHMIPPEEHWINIHPYTLHLWDRIDGPTVPPALYEDQ